MWPSALHAQTVGPVPRVWAVLTVPAPVAARGSHPVGSPNHVPSHICAETDGPRGGRGGYYVRAAWDARRDRGGVARQGGRHKRHVCFATLRWHTISVQQPVRHTIPRRLCHPAVCPCGASQGWPVGAVPVQMWQRCAQSRCICGSGEPSPGADVAAVRAVPVQMWQRRAQSRCRCAPATASS